MAHSLRFACALAALALWAGCSDDAAKQTPNLTPNEEGPGPTPQGDGGTDGAQGDVAVEAAPGTIIDLGNITVVDVPDVPCADVSGPGAEITPAAPGGYPIDTLGRFGTKRFAVSSEGLELFTFGANGASSSSIGSTVIAAAARGAELDVLRVEGEKLLFDRLDQNGDAIGGSVITLVEGRRETQAIGATDTHALVVWSSDTAIVGRLFDQSGAIVGNVDLGADAAASGTYLLEVVTLGSGFGVVWTRERADKRVETMFQKVDATGTTTPAVSVLLASGDHSVVGAVATSDGAALVLNQGLPSASAVVVRVNADGQAISPALRLLGSQRAFGIASQSGELGIVASRGNRAVFRSLGTDGTPLSSWICLDNLPDSGAGFPASAIDVDGAGYATVAWAANGAHVFRKLDRTGAVLPL